MLDVLKTKQQIEQSRQAIDALGVSILETQLEYWARRLKLSKKLPVGDHVKSWDVKATLDFINTQLDRESKILDIGAFCSELPVLLSSLNYSKIHAIDLNPNILEMPNNDKVKYQIGDFVNMPYNSGEFDAVTSISVIEHGYQPEALLREVSRVLKPGGFFIASFDYWPEKINTGSTKFFEMDWLIFSKSDVNSLISEASKFQLFPHADLAFDSNEKTVHCAGFDYTFAWLVLRKSL